MPNKWTYIVLLLSMCSFSSFSQTENDSIKTSIGNNVVIDSIVKKPIDALSPSKAAFYSAILPGLGQAYNKKYWKIPIVYAAIGTGIYFYLDNTKEYNRYRDAYKSRLAGYETDEFYGPISGSPRVSNDGLIRAQRTLRRNRELSLLITFGLYALNIIDANVDAHLLQYNIDENLTFKPHFQYNEKENASDLGLTLNYKF
ncbi:MAG: DUF5683 domain-containing protein [Gelidibacter sp.]